MFSVQTDRDGGHAQPDGEADQDLVPEPADEIQEGDEDEGCGH